MLDLFGSRSGAKRGRLLARGLVLLLILSSCTLATQAEAAGKGGSDSSRFVGDPEDCDQPQIEQPDGTDVVLPGADPLSCPIPRPVDCTTFLGSEADTPAQESNLHQVRAVCDEYPGVLVAACPGGPDLHPQLTLPDAAVVHGDPEQIDGLLDVLFAEYDLAGLLVLYTDPADPDFYSAAYGLGYAVVPLDAATLEPIIDMIGGTRLRLSPVHVYQGHKMSRGHPVDEFDDLGPAGNPVPVVEVGSSPVVVVDAGGSPGDGGVRGHGAFASEVVRANAAFAERIDFDVKKNTFFDDTDIVPAILSGFFGPDPEAESYYPPGTVVNLSFGAYNCGLATTWLAKTLQRLINNDHLIVASAGNDETNELAFPAALAFDWNKFGVEVFTEDGEPLSGSLPHDQITSVGSLDDLGDRSCFSNHGVWVETWFPGEEVYAEDTGSVLWGGTWSGTSFAAPQAAAALAKGPLAEQKAPEALTQKHLHKVAKNVELLSYCTVGSGYEPQSP